VVLLDPFVLNSCIQHVNLLGPDELPFPRRCPQEWGIFFLRQLCKPLVQHTVIELFDDHIPVSPDSAWVLQGQFMDHGDTCSHGFFICGDGKKSFLMIGNREDSPGTRIFCLGEMDKMFLYQWFHFGAVKVSDGDDCHQIGTIPIPVESFQHIVIEFLDDFLFSDGQPVGIMGPFKNDRELFVHHSGPGTASQPPFLDDDTPFFVDFLVFDLTCTDIIGIGAAKLQVQLKIVTADRKMLEYPHVETIW